ncbi:hypothetical protein [Paraburkholderia sp. J10-1]|uniref:hypothetical protein n=1 Tax=Paraburkholderia sp. J10-1 TaxID=2805430 RepID=UPI002AB7DB0F|nr:hypothetical protein [Paraburkholderia sp. J10-1]
MSLIKIQTAITGYQGLPVSLLGGLDTETGLLMVAKEMPYGDREATATFITNDPRTDERDGLFIDDEKLQRALRLFFRMRRTGLIDLMKTVSKHDPENRIESDGTTERGVRYRLAPDISNGNVAVLAMVEAADTAYRIEEASSFADELSSMFFTIGGE